MPDLAPALDDVRAAQIARWEGGGRPRLEELLAGLPTPDGEQMLDLIYAEVLLREEFGERPTLEEYLARFPALAAGLRRQFALHCAVGVLDTQPGRGADTGVMPPDAGHPPAAIGPYDVLGEAGRGGMGVVYKGRHRTLTSRLAAIKILRGDGPDERARFLAEARAVASLRHANIVQVHEVSAPDDAEPFVALEYVAGGTLAQKINGTPLPPREAAALLVPLAEAVAHAHAAGIVHRDLKPQNVLIGVDGAPKVTDFGLAKTAGDSSHTRSGAILGTPSYMAPEQARAENASVGPPADVYGLGAILYEMLTGRPPFRADSVMTTLKQVIDDDPVAPRTLNPSVPADLETVCLKCLAKEQGRRYGGARELADDMRRFLAGEPVRARPAGVVERAVKWVRRRPAAALALGGSVAALAAFVAVWVGFTLQLNHEKAEALKGWREAERLKGVADGETKVAREKEAEARKQEALALAQSKRATTLLAVTARAVDDIVTVTRGGKVYERVASNPGAVLFKLACFYAQAAKSVRESGLDASDAAKLSEQFSLGSVQLLNCAETLGYFGKDRPDNRKALHADPALTPLRGRADYLELAMRVK